MDWKLELDALIENTMALANHAKRIPIPDLAIAMKTAEQALAEGRERAKARGVVLGRKPKLTKHQQSEAIARREAGEVLTDIARSYNVSHSTISRL
jgi:hypothetical protein